ncbi:MAG: phosphatidylcholine/phosphatidylserine synthase [Rickettsiales bacterium]|nr:phosphatidylcholine/phosphatidylserine synthase [Rickettsiales bacterium]
MEKEEKSSFEIYKLIPHMITMSALCLGLFAVRLAIIGNFEAAGICVIISCLCDGIDGNVARRLNASSEFGAQMDSLADFFNFGIAPGFIVYFWKMEEFDAIKKVAWFPVLLLAICMTIRLARFNVALTNEDHENPLNKYFFKGVPAPMAASLVLFPMVVSFEFPEFTIFSNPLFVIINTTVVALLAGSVIPTPCLKKVKFKSSQKQLLLMTIGVLLIGLLIKVWLFSSIICFMYIIMIFIGWGYYYKFYKELNGNKK